MSSPYVYTPFQQYPSFQPSYYDPGYTTPANSPFVPNLSLYPSSPRLSAPGTPNTPARRFPEEQWSNPQPRSRRPSWHGPPPVAPVVPFPTPASPAFASSYLDVAPTYFHTRRHSFGNDAQEQWPPYAWGAQPSSPWTYTPQPPPFQIHPLINAESPRFDFIFDLSSPEFNPVRVVGPGQTAHLNIGELNQPATHPAITRLKIVCEVIPQWPIVFEFSGSFNGSAPPITLGDVLVGLHRSLQTRITHMDWARLTRSEETAIARAYTRRCRSVPAMTQFQQTQGVRRVDYLKEKVMFKGLIRVAGEQGFETMRLVVG